MTVDALIRYTHEAEREIYSDFELKLIVLSLGLCTDISTLQILMFNPFKPEFTIAISIHYKP